MNAKNHQRSRQGREECHQTNALVRLPLPKDGCGRGSARRARRRGHLDVVLGPADYRDMKKGVDLGLQGIVSVVKGRCTGSMPD